MKKSIEHTEHYCSLISKFKDTVWEQLSEKDKTKLVNAYILRYGLRIPSEPEYIEALNYLLKDSMSNSAAYLRHIIECTVKPYIELDLDRECMEEDLYWWQNEEQDEKYQQIINDKEQEKMVSRRYI